MAGNIDNVREIKRRPTRIAIGAMLDTNAITVADNQNCTHLRYRQIYNYIPKDTIVINNHYK